MRGIKQKNYYLKEKINAIREEIGEGNVENDDVFELREKIKTTKISAELRKKLEKEVGLLVLLVIILVCPLLGRFLQVSVLRIRRCRFVHII